MLREHFPAEYKREVQTLAEMIEVTDDPGKLFKIMKNVGIHKKMFKNVSRRSPRRLETEVERPEKRRPHRT